MQHCAPLGKASAGCVVGSAALAQVVHTLSHSLAVGVGEDPDALVDLDPGNDSVLLEDVREPLARLVLLVERLLERDAAADVLAQPLGREQKVAVCLAVLAGVLHVDSRETLSDRAGRLVRGEDALARGRDGARGGDELGRKVLLGLGHDQCGVACGAKRALTTLFYAST